MFLRVFQIVMLFLLFLLALAQGAYLFHQWTKVPLADLSHWRIEYASLNFDEDAAHVLEVQLRAESSIIFKKSSLPQMEFLLTNIAGDPLAHRIFEPKEWVAPDLPLKNDWLIYGVPSQTEITIAMPLEIPKDASGFQVHLLYENTLNPKK